MQADSRTVDSFDGKTVALNELPSGDIEIVISEWTEYQPTSRAVLRGRGTKLLAKCVLTPKQFSQLIMPSVLVRKP